MNCDYLIIGGGIAGASAGYWLAEKGSVVLLERESQPGYHSTGRSAALFTVTYGNAVICGLAAASRPFFDTPPDGFADVPLLTERGVMFIARADQRAQLDAALAEAKQMVENCHQISGAQAREIVPVLDAGYIDAAIVEPEAMDMDVDAIHQGFLRGMRENGGKVVTNAEVTALARTDGAWIAETPQGNFSAGVVINAAGAWSDEIAMLAGAQPVGLTPKRRTALTFDPPEGIGIESWPSVIDIDEEFYFKPDAGKLLGSPADETPVPPQDIQPEELDIATAVDRIQTATNLEIRRIDSQWAGLRSFVEDKTPVVGFDPAAEGFFWLAGQGGYGIMTSPAMGHAAAALASGGDLPADIAKVGLTSDMLSPARFSE